MAETQRDLLDEDGENRALRTFLMQYGLPGLTVGAMRDHMKRSGWGGEYWPFFVSASNRDSHLTKAGAQFWIRHLLGMEGVSRPAEVDNEGLPAVLFDGHAVYSEITRKLGKAHCHSHETVSATLDAVVRLVRAAPPERAQ